MASLDSGHIVEKIKGEEDEHLREKYFIFSDGAIRLQPEGWLYPSTFEKYANLIYNFKVKPTDIFVLALPKSGIHWVPEIVWNLVHNPNLDNPEANISIEARCRSIESDHRYALTGLPPIDPNGELMQKFNQLCQGKDPSDGIYVQLAAVASDPRLIKTHLSCSLLSPDMFKISKVIYLARDPRDIMVSWYHFTKLHLVNKFNGSLDEFVDDYISDRCLYGPHWEHVRLAWEKRNDPNLLFLYYEDIKEDPKSEIRKIDQFLGTNRTNEQIDNVVHFTSFSVMKERNKDNPPSSKGNTYFDKEVQKQGGCYFRKGTVGSWKEDFTPELQKKVNTWMTKNIYKFGNEFKYKV